MTNATPQPSPTVPSQPPSVQNKSGTANTIFSAVNAIATITVIFLSLAQIIDFLHGKQGNLLTAFGIMLLGAPFLFVTVIFYRRRNYKEFRIDVLLMATVVAGSMIVFSSPHTSGPVAQPPSVGAADPPPTKTPPTAPTSSPPPPVAQVEFSRPNANVEINAGENVNFAGNVAGLAGDTLWVVAKPDVGDGRYYLSQYGTVADRDGPWRFVAIKVGGNGDKGHNIVFYALQAKRSCSDFLAAVGPDEKGNRTFNLLPEGCVVGAQRAVAVAR